MVILLGAPRGWQVEGHEACGRGVVRAARIRTLLQSPSWNWCGLVTFFFVIAALGGIVVAVINTTDILDNFTPAVQWMVALLGLPGALTLANFLLQVSYYKSATPGI